MKRRAGTYRIATAWWTLILLTAIVAFLFVTGVSFAGTFRSYVPVTLTSERAGLVMETNADVMLRLSYRLGQVDGMSEGHGPNIVAAHVNLRQHLVLDRISLGVSALYRWGR